MMQTSTGAQDKEHLPQGKQSAMENDASHNNQHSALFYILQEVSKLPSPIHNSFLDTDPTSTWLKETSRQGPFIVKKQEADGHSFKITHSSFQHNFPHLAPHNQVKKIKEESQASKVTSLIEPHPECKSTWKVLSLINLHCQKLRHHSDVEESDSSSVSSARALDHSIDKSSTVSVDVTDQGDGGDFMLVGYSCRPSVLSCEREEIPACGSPAKYMKACSGGAGSFKTDFCVKNTKVGSCVDSRTVEKLDNVRAELVEENGRASSQAHYREQKEKEDKYSVNGQSEWNPECKKDNLFSEQDILNVPLPENALSQIAPTASRITFNSDVDAHLALSKPALILDHNANLALTTEALCDSQLCPTSSSLFSITEKCYPVTNQGHKITPSKQERTHTHLEKKSPLIVQVESSSYNDEANSLPSATSEPEHRPVQKEEIAPPSSQQWRIKARRKQPHPSRSVDIQDPDIQGVTFRMDTELDDSRERCRLLITSKYSKELSKSARKPRMRMRTRTSQKSRKICSSDEESELTISVSQGKICASCCTRKTPMWRDAEDGTPLCNACGIRYKKYRVRCINCWHIPRKEGNSNSCCHKCGNFVKLTSALRKHTT